MRDRAWAEIAGLIDLQLSPLGLAAMDALEPRIGQRILDIGCGAGQTVQQLSARIGPTGHVIGVDIAPRVLAVAGARCAGLSNVTLVEADAATLDLPNGSVDAVYSRFGVMAIEDPMAAFANFRRMTKRGGRLGFACWRSLVDNELDWFALQAAGFDSTAADTTPFRFENRDYIVDLLQSASYRGIRVEALDLKVTSGGPDEMTRVLTKVGALGQILRESPALRCRAESKVREALSAAGHDDMVCLKAATWIVTADAG